MSISASSAAQPIVTVNRDLQPFLQIKGENIPNDIGYLILSFARLDNFSSLPVVSHTWRVLYEDKTLFDKFLKEHFKGNSEEYQKHMNVLRDEHQKYMEVLRLSNTIKKNALKEKGYWARRFCSISSLVNIQFKYDGHVSALTPSGVEHSWELIQPGFLEKEIVRPSHIQNFLPPEPLKGNWKEKINFITLVIFNKETKGHLQIKEEEKVLWDQEFPGIVLEAPIFNKGVLACILAPKGILHCESVMIFDFFKPRAKSKNTCSIQ